MLLEFSIRDTYFFSSVKAILQHFIFYITLHIQLHLFPAWRAGRVMPPVKWLFASLPLALLLVYQASRASLYVWVTSG